MAIFMPSLNFLSAHDSRMPAWASVTHWRKAMFALTSSARAISAEPRGSLLMATASMTRVAVQTVSMMYLLSSMLLLSSLPAAASSALPPFSLLAPLPRAPRRRAAGVSGRRRRAGERVASREPPSAGCLVVQVLRVVRLGEEEPALGEQPGVLERERRGQSR